MRWDDLFADLEGRFEELADADDDAELSVRTRLEIGRITLVERLAGARDAALRLRLAGGVPVAGTLRRLGGDWLLLADQAAELIVPLASVAAVEGLSIRTGMPLGVVDTRFDLRKALRGLARGRAPVTVQTTFGGELTGTVDRVGADFLELAVHPAWEVRRAASVQSVVLIPLAAVVLVRSAPIG